MGSPPKKFKGQRVKFGLKFRVWVPITLGLVGLGVTSRDFSTRRAAWQGCSSGHYFWGRPAPKIWKGKKRLKFSAISDNFWVWSRISPEWIHVSKVRKVVDQLQPLPRRAKKDCELWSTNKKVIGSHVVPPKLHFSGHYISALKGCWPLKF